MPLTYFFWRKDGPILSGNPMLLIYICFSSFPVSYTVFIVSPIHPTNKAYKLQVSWRTHLFFLNIIHRSIRPPQDLMIVIIPNYVALA